MSDQDQGLVVHDTAILQDGGDRFAFADAARQLPELRKLTKRSASARSLLSDVHASLYRFRPEILEPEETSSPHRDVVSEAMGTGEYARFRAVTRLDDLASALGTLELGKALAQALPEEALDDDQDDQDGQDGQPGNGKGGAPQSALRGCGGDPDAQRRKLRGIVSKAAESTEEAVEAYRAFVGPGAGLGAGDDSTMDLAESIRLVRQLSSGKLKKITERLGRLRRVASGKRPVRLKRGPDDVVGVELGNDLMSLIPSELQALATPELEETALLRYVQGRMLQVKREGKEKADRGPIVMLVDESGSMGGEKEVWAKAVTLAMLGIAQKDKRHFAVVGFNEYPRVSDWGTDPSQATILSWLERGPGGGTLFRPALDAGMKLIEDAREGGTFEKADMIIVTDADSSDIKSQAWRKAWAARCEATGAHLYVVYVRSSLTTFDGIADGSARIWDLSEDDEAIDLVFSI
jgi:uncharacterized protein with von Willebrand factor type A (vWA) domain